MKKGIIYIILFLSGITLGSLLFMDYGFREHHIAEKENQYLVSRKPIEDRKQDFIQSASSMLGESIIVNGTVREAYKNRNNEVVIYLKDSNIPILINCTLQNSDLQVLEPLRLGETINLQGIFTQLGDEMHLEGCRLISRAPQER